MFGGADRYLESAAGRRLRDASAEGRLRIAVPMVVLLESEANHRRAVRKAEAQFTAARDKLDQLRASQGRDLHPRKLRYREDIEQLVSEADGKLLPIPEVPHARLIGRAVSRKRPFDANGDGYRDALVWESVLELLEVAGDRVILISNDSTAFSETRERPQLAADLLNELAEVGHAGRVSLYFDIRELTAQLPEAQRLVDHWSKVFVDNPELSEALDVYLLKLANEEAPAVIGTANLTANARNGEFLGFSNPQDRRVTEVWVGPDGSAILDVVITLDYQQEFEAAYSPATPPTSTAPTTQMTIVASGALTLRFELIQQDRDDLTRFAGRIIGWRDLATFRSGGEPPDA